MEEESEREKSGGGGCEHVEKGQVGTRPRMHKKLQGENVFFFKQKAAYEFSLGLVGSERCIRYST